MHININIHPHTKSVANICVCVCICADYEHYVTPHPAQQLLPRGGAQGSQLAFSSQTLGAHVLYGVQC